MMMGNLRALLSLTRSMLEAWSLLDMDLKEILKSVKGDVGFVKQCTVQYLITVY